MDHWRGLRAAERRSAVVVDAAELAGRSRRRLVPLHWDILVAAGFDPERTVNDAEGRDWGLEARPGLRAASILRHVQLARLSDDDVNLLLFWGCDAAPLVEIALHYLERNPFHATNRRTASALLVNVAEAVCLPALPLDPTPLRLRYGARLTAVCALAQAMLADGSAGKAAVALHDSPGQVLREAQRHLNRSRPQPPRLM